MPPLARDFVLPARAGDATEDTLVEEDEEHPTVFLGAFAPTAAIFREVEVLTMLIKPSCMTSLVKLCLQFSKVMSVVSKVQNSSPYGNVALKSYTLKFSPTDNILIQLNS